MQRCSCTESGCDESTREGSKGYAQLAVVVGDVGDRECRGVRSPPRALLRRRVRVIPKFEQEWG